MNKPYEYKRDKFRCPMWSIIEDHLSPETGTLPKHLQRLKSVLLLLREACPIEARPDTSIFNPVEATIMILEKHCGKGSVFTQENTAELVKFQNWYRRIGTHLPKHRNSG